MGSSASSPRPESGPGPESGSGAESGSGPEYGPGGYLPERAAKRARKIVLREQMGLGWPIAALVAGIVLVGLGVVYLLAGTAPPSEPFVAAGPIDEIDPRGAATLEVGGAQVVVVRAGGGVRAFAHPGVPVRYCPASGRLESPEAGMVWTPDGRLTGGDGQSLPGLPAQVHDGELYIDPTSPLPAPAPRARGEQPECPP